MNKDLFHQYIKSPDKLNAESLVELDDLVQEYPYFQAARMLYVKNLKNTENIRFSKQLKCAAAHINNRQLLFGLLNGICIGNDGSFFPVNNTDYLDQDHNLEYDKSTHGGILSLADDDHGQHSSESSVEILPKYDKSIYVQELERFIPIADLDLLLIDFPIDDPDTLDFDFDDKLPDITDGVIENQDKEVTDSNSQGVSSRDLIEQFIHSDIDRSASTPTKEHPTERIDLIDDFIRKNPRMPKPEDSSLKKDDISLESLEENDAFMTETLAEIYLKQGYYYRALQAYEKLSLKNPEKSIYFASQIQKIKKLITNQ